jgi:hypothetical protein
MTSAPERALVHARSILSRLVAEKEASGRYRIALHASGGMQSSDFVLRDGAVHEAGVETLPDVVLVFEAEDYLACVAGQRTLHQSAFEGRARVRGDRQRALHFARAFAEATETETTAPRVVEGGRAMAARGACLPRPSETIAASLPPVTEVTRIAQPGRERFRRDFVASGTPLILTETLGEWDLAAWSRKRLRAAHGKLLGIVRPASVDSGAPPYIGVSIRSIAELLDELDADGGTARYLAYNELPAELSSSIRHPPYFDRAEYLDPPNLWLGPAGTVTHLHRDGSDNLFIQLWGSKRFILFSPDQRPLLSAWSAGDSGLDVCDVDPEHPDHERFPQFRDARAITCDVAAGEMLFLPEGWFHHVRSLAPSLSINFWTRTKR